MHTFKLALVAVTITLFLFPASAWAQIDLSGGPPPPPPGGVVKPKPTKPKPTRPKMTAAQRAAAAEAARKRREAAAAAENNEDKPAAFDEDALSKLLDEKLETMKKEEKEKAEKEANEKAAKQLEEDKASYRNWIYAGLGFLLLLIVSLAIYLYRRQDSFETQAKGFETRVKKRTDDRLTQFAEFIEDPAIGLANDADDPYDEEGEPDAAE